MAKIPFPDIPNLPGVSDIPVNAGNIIPGAADLSVTNIISAVRSGSFLSAYQTLFGLKYGIYKNGRPILEVDTITELNVSNQSQISDFPIETGAFSSYNKVALPSTYTMDLIKTNSLIGSDKTDVINILQELLRPAKLGYLLSAPTENSTNNDESSTFGFGLSDIKNFFGRGDGPDQGDIQFVDVVTPDKTYSNVQLESYNVTENNETGLALIITVGLREIMQPINLSDNNPTEPDGADKESLGEMISRNFNEATDYVKDSASRAISAIRGVF